MTGIFIFRRDLRLDDNYGLLKLQKLCDVIIPIFCLDKNQIVKTKKNQYYFSNNAVQFICESLIDLNNQLLKYGSKLRLFFGNPPEIIEKLIKKLDIKYVAFNTDFSIYSNKRDQEIKEICELYDITLITANDDYTLYPLEIILRDSEKNLPFKQFGAFYKHVKDKKPNKPLHNKYHNYLGKRVKITGEYKKGLDKFYKENKEIAQNGGRTIALKKLNNISQYKEYDNMHDRLDYNTTNISAALNIGCISIREAFYAIKDKTKSELLLRQLYWRDFYLCVLIYADKGNHYDYMDDRFNKIKWKNSLKDFNKLWNSQTGFLLIDACMKEMQVTGFCHNRGRLLLGIFWTKYLLINSFHPKFGSQVGYSRLLVDAIGPSQNKMNHQWLTELDYPGRQFGKGISGRPMKVSNEQIKKFDPYCIYIKKWLPHLKDIPNEDLFDWDGIKHTIHPKPMFDPIKKYNEWFNLTKVL